MEQTKLEESLSWEKIVKQTYMIIDKQRREADGERILNEIRGKGK